MAEFMEQLGLGFLMETEEQVRSLWNYIAQNGKAIEGYYGSQYLNLEFGNAQLILRTIRNEQEKSMEIVGMDTHSAGRCVWEVCLSGMNLARKDADIMERRCAVQRTGDGGGLAVVDIVNADVLPSFAEGEVVKLQMIAVPEHIEYYRDAEQYADAQQEQTDGKNVACGRSYDACRTDAEPESGKRSF